MKRWLFNQIHSRNLIYNQCWEDPAIDKLAIGISSSDRIVMITSAGCNALDYLLSGPSQIHCVDLNPHQTALMELKLAAIRTLPYSDFFKMFGAGRIEGHRKIYRRHLRKCLGVASRRIWDRRIDYFRPEGRGLYFHGTAGLFARMLNWYIDARGTLRKDLEHIQALSDVEEQAAFYRERIAQQLWSPALCWVLRCQLTMSMLGVPAEQVRAIRQTAGLDLAAFIKARVERVFTKIPMRDNYFWRVYINGMYTRDCCPNYLKEEYFDTLRERCGRIRPHTMAFGDFLKFTEGPFSVYVLLDHMDWLANSGDMLQQEWKGILRTAEAGARIIYRSSGTSFDHIPEFAMMRIKLLKDIASALHERDRVGTYGSFHLANVLPARA